MQRYSTLFEPKMMREEDEKMRPTGSKKPSLSIKSFDLYTKIQEEYRVQTTSGATLSMIGWIIMSLLIVTSIQNYMTPEYTEHMVVDTKLGTKLKINLDISFPALTCAEVHLDCMDVAGDNQLNVEHEMKKQRLTSGGKPIGEAGIEIIGEPDTAPPPPSNYCGSCYGAESPTRACCNDCKELTKAYEEKGWGVGDILKTSEQCMREKSNPFAVVHKGEGCRVSGSMTVNKVAGNFHIAFGESIVRDGHHIHQFDPILAPSFNLSHSIHHLSFHEVENALPSIYSSSSSFSSSSSSFELLNQEVGERRNQQEKRENKGVGNQGGGEGKREVMWMREEIERRGLLKNVNPMNGVTRTLTSHTGLTQYFIRVTPTYLSPPPPTPSLISLLFSASSSFSSFSSFSSSLIYSFPFMDSMMMMMNNNNNERGGGESNRRRKEGKEEEGIFWSERLKNDHTNEEIILLENEEQEIEIQLNKEIEEEKRKEQEEKDIKNNQEQEKVNEKKNDIDNHHRLPYAEFQKKLQEKKQKLMKRKQILIEKKKEEKRKQQQQQNNKKSKQTNSRFPLPASSSSSSPQTTTFYSHLTNQYSYTERFRPLITASPPPPLPSLPPLDSSNSTSSSSSSSSSSDLSDKDQKSSSPPPPQKEEMQSLVLPGIFFVYEMSPFLVRVAPSATSPPLSHLLTRLCASIGGVFAILALVDAGWEAIWKRLNKLFHPHT